MSMKWFLINALYRRWSHWVETSIEGKILGAMLTVGLLSFGVSIASMGKEVVVAASFGTGDALDAFLIAFLSILFLSSVVLESLTPALMPTYIQVREQQGQEAAQDLFSQIMVVTMALLITVAAVVALLAPYFFPFLGLGFKAEKLALTQRLFYFLLPAMIIRGVATIWSAILNAGEYFRLAALAPIAVPISSIIALLVWGSALGIYALVVGTMGGVLLELLLVGWALNRSKTALIPRWHRKSPALRQVIGQYFPMLTGSALMGGITLVDSAMVATLAPGSVAALNYGNKVVATITGIGAGALGTVVLPFFSKLVGVGDWTTVRHILKKYSLLILLVTIPITLLLFFF